MFNIFYVTLFTSNGMILEAFHVQKEFYQTGIGKKFLVRKSYPDSGKYIYL